MAYKNCIIQIPGSRQTSLPPNPVALLSAFDKALEANAYQILECTEIHEIQHPATGEFFTYLMLEIDENDTKDLFDRISEMVSYACSLDTVEISDHHHIVTIDYCVYSFK
ncbi:MAG: hypothetical protein ACLGH8_14490 [Bacteroidia bacterium]